jgi:lysozyme
MILARRLTTLAIIALLAACGGGRDDAGSNIPPARTGEIFAPGFGDAKPVAFTGTTPAHYPVHGIDVARFQSDIDWGAARRAGVNFAFIKATEGGDLFDRQFNSHWNGAGRAGVERGAYHFYYFCTSPEDQANWFIRNVPRGNMLPPVLDMEWNPFSPTCAHVRPPAAEVQDQMRRWLAVIEAHYGQRPVIYTTPEFYRQNRLGEFRGYDFWLRSTARNPAQVYPDERWSFWQYSATGRVDGIAGDVDLNLFAGNRAQWQSWVAARKR